MRVTLVLCVLIMTLHMAVRADAPRPAPPAPQAQSTAPDTVRAATAQDQRALKAELATLGEVEVPGEKQWQRRKSAKVAVFSNMVLPGLGQVYNGRRLKAATMVGLMTYYVGRAWVEYKNQVRHEIARDTLQPNTVEWKLEQLYVDFHRENMKDHIWWAGATYLIGMLDAFVDAHLYDVRAVDPTVIRGLENQQYIGLSVKF